MRTDYAVWIGLFIIAALVTLATKYFAYFPGDVTVERWVQSLVPPNLNWAEGVSRTAEFPWVLLILALVFALSWVLRRARRASLHPQLGGNVGSGRVARSCHCPAKAVAGTGARLSTTLGL